MFWACSFHVLNWYFNEQYFVILWVSWCKNKASDKNLPVHIFFFIDQKRKTIIRNIQMIQDIEYWLWKSDFDTFWRPFIMSIHKKGSALPRRTKVQSTFWVHIRIFFLCFLKSLSVLSLNKVRSYWFFCQMLALD